MSRHRPSLADLHAASACGVIAARRLVELGVPESTVYRRCRDGGPWQRLAPGVVLLATGTPTPDQLLIAALLHGGRDAVLTGLEACRRHRVRRGPGPGGTLQLLVPHDRQVRHTWFVRVDRTRRMPPPVWRAGVPLAPGTRAVADAVRTLRSEREITELIADALQRGLCTLTGLTAELDAGGQHGSATPRAVLRAIAAGLRSAAELDARTLAARTGLPEPCWNAAVYGADGLLLGVADAWWDAVAFGWEINSLEWHLAPADYAREQAKFARFTAAGAVVLPTLAKRLRTDAAGVRAELVAAHATATRRARPALRAVAVPPGTVPPRQWGGFTAAR